jgi:hypothetical protein
MLKKIRTKITRILDRLQNFLDCAQIMEDSARMAIYAQALEKENRDLKRQLGLAPEPTEEATDGR